jgi:hypothetical protein
MSDELRLPDHLAACEARLAAQMLPASGINRDELLYRAGWAAGAETARLAVVTPSPSKGGARGGITAAWSLTSAAVAASIAVVVTLQMQSLESRHVVAQPADVSPQWAAEDVEPKPATTLAPRVELARASAKTPNVGRLQTTGLIGLRQRAMSNVWAEAPGKATTASDTAMAPAPQTARELMQEFMPAESTRQYDSWPWKPTSSGDSI